MSFQYWKKKQPQVQLNFCMPWNKICWRGCILILKKSIRNFVMSYWKKIAINWNLLRLFFFLCHHIYVSVLGCTINLCFLKFYGNFFKCILHNDTWNTQLNTSKILHIFKKFMSILSNWVFFQKYILGTKRDTWEFSIINL